MGEKEKAATDPATDRTMNWTPVADEGRSTGGAGQPTENLEREGYVELQPGDEDPAARSTSVKSGKSNSSD